MQRNSHTGVLITSLIEQNPATTGSLFGGSTSDGHWCTLRVA
ncbi:Uncharacterised protein [Vibrio cholerae]|nr:Uncharacterised protein [Vibrio cholerae]